MSKCLIKEAREAAGCFFDAAKRLEATLTVFMNWRAEL